MFKKPKYFLSEEDSRSLLRDQRITPEEPGTILLDVAAILEAIGLEGVSTSSKQDNLPSGMLPDLNTRLHDPIELELKRPLLRDYPNLAGPYILLRVLGLVRSERSRVCVDEARLARWQALNPCEQYFALLKTWLFEPFFPEYRNGFEPPEAEVRRGAHVFKPALFGSTIKDLTPPEGLRV